MRKHWQVSEQFRGIALGVWVLGWLPLSIGLQAIFGGCDHSGACGMNASSASAMQPMLISLCVWFGVVLVPVALWAAYALVTSAWKHRPRRVSGPVVEDLRTIYPPHLSR